MRTSQTLDRIAGRVLAAGLEEESAAITAEAARVRTIESALDAVLDSMAEPIVFPARRVPGLRLHAEHMAQAAD